MSFLFPWSFLVLLFIPFIILLYILKQKFEEREVSSIYLWRGVIKDLEVNTPWQKLRRNILLFMQIIIIILFSLALCKPYFIKKGMYSDNIIIAIDNSGSMSTMYNKNSRLQEAKDRGIKLVEDLKGESKIIVISYNKASKVEVNGVTSKSEAINKIKEIKSSNAIGNNEDIIYLVKSLSKQYKNYRAIFYTDSPLDISNINGEVVSISSSLENVSLDYISYSEEKNNLNTLVRVTNRSNNNVNRELSLYLNEKILDIKNISLKPLETQTVYFNDIDFKKLKSNLNTAYLSAEITEKDALLEDNVIYEVIKHYDNEKVLLVSEKNVFLEKALTSIKNLEIYKTNNSEKITDKYNLYIFDGNMPKELPKDGNILIINPNSYNDIIKVQGEQKGGTCEILKHPITNYMDNAYFTISKTKKMDIPYWATPIINASGNPCAFVGELNGRKILVIGFDLHSSDFVLIPEFPIFIHNLAEYLLNTDIMEKTKYHCGEEVKINPLSDTTKLQVKNPKGENESLELKYPIKPYESTENIGIYSITQKSKYKSDNHLFAVNFPSEIESKQSAEVKSVQSYKSEKLSGNYVMSIQNILIFIVLIFIILEWVIYCRM